MDNKMDTDETKEPKKAKNKAAPRETKLYLPGRSRQLKDGEELTVDENAYVMYHKFETGHPCLSFDILNDPSHEKQSDYPMSCYLVAGTQAEKIRDNGIIVMKLTNLTKNKEKKEDNDDDEESSDSDSDDDESNKPNMLSTILSHHGGINRIRATNISTSAVCAVWNDQGKVQLWNLTSALRSVESMQSNNESVKITEKPLFTFAGHGTEGYAMDWSPRTVGKFASGDNRKNIHLWKMNEGGIWVVDQRPFNAHKSSVEDIQWSPNEDEVFASCSSDKTIRLWDCRVTPQNACICTVENAHDSDVNVISWNTVEPLLVSGGDDCALKVWDLKFIQQGHPVAMFKHHSKPISSVHWYKHDSTVFAAAGQDNQVTIWDLSVEPDDEEENPEIPPQLMFIHSGQDEIKEVRWQTQLPGTLITTALDGFNIFRPINF